MPAVPESLKSRALRAGIWSTALAFAGTALRFGSSLILTRLLVPEVFGIVALSMVLFTVVSLLSDVGMRQSVIYNEKGEDAGFLGTIWGISVVRGMVISVLSGAIALVVYLGQQLSWFATESVYGHPQLPAVLALTGCTAAIGGFKSPKLYVCERRLDLKSPGYIELASQFAGTVVTILLALNWRSVWPIIAGSYVSAVTTVLLSLYWLKGPIGRIGWHREHAREIILFGRWIMLSSITYVIASNSDRLLFGIWFTPEMLAFYALALNIVLSADMVISRPFTSVGAPAFGEMVRRGGEGLRSVFFRFRLPYDLVSVGAAGFLFVAGQLLIDVLYDPRYTAAGRALQIMSFSLLFPRFSVIGTVHTAHGNPQIASWASVIRLVSVLLFIPVGYWLGGHEGAMWAMALHMLPASLFLWWTSRALSLDDVAYELRVLAAWPAGAALGWLAVVVARPPLAALGLSH
jgi:O-antigen/teichoic acid export membrane protein